MSEADLDPGAAHDELLAAVERDDAPVWKNSLIDDVAATLECDREVVVTAFDRLHANGYLYTIARDDGEEVRRP